MTKTDFLKQLDEIMEFSPGTLNGTESLESLEEWDSMAAVSFISLADEHCGLVLSPRSMASCETVHDLLALLGDKIVE